MRIVPHHSSDTASTHSILILSSGTLRRFVSMYRQKYAVGAGLHYLCLLWATFTAAGSCEHCRSLLAS
jgi:hypothetical protein